jgi:hypothetical protein
MSRYYLFTIGSTKSKVFFFFDYPIKLESVYLGYFGELNIFNRINIEPFACRHKQTYGTVKKYT